MIKVCHKVVPCGTPVLITLYQISKVVLVVWWVLDTPSVPRNLTCFGNRVLFIYQRSPDFGLVSFPTPICSPFVVKE